jgi:bifunctional DNase/RNase
MATPFALEHADTGTQILVPLTDCSWTGLGPAPPPRYRDREVIGMVEVRIASLGVDSRSNSPVIILRPLKDEDEHNRILPIWIGTPEATSILLALEGAEPPRPMTHDLMRNVIEQLGYAVQRVEITRVEEGTFYAALIVRGEDHTFAIDARPSDSIALAVRVGAPVFVAEEVLEAAAVEAEPELDEEAEVEAFREFLDAVEPSDFSS